MKNLFSNPISTIENQHDAGFEVHHFVEVMTERAFYYEFRNLYLVSEASKYILGIISIGGGIAYMMYILASLPIVLNVFLSIFLLFLLEFLYSNSLSFLLKKYLNGANDYLTFGFVCFVILLSLSVFTTSKGIELWLQDVQNQTVINLISLDSINQRFDEKQAKINQIFDEKRNKLNLELKQDGSYYAIDVARKMIKEKQKTFEVIENERVTSLSSLKKERENSLNLAIQENKARTTHKHRSNNENTYTYITIVVVCEVLKLLSIWFSMFYIYKCAKQGLLTNTIKPAANVLPFQFNSLLQIKEALTDLMPLLSESAQNVQNQTVVNSETFLKKEIGFGFRTNAPKASQNQTITFDELTNFFNQKKYDGNYKGAFLALATAKITQSKIDLSNDFLSKSYHANIKILVKIKDFVDKSEIQDLNKIVSSLTKS